MEPSDSQTFKIRDASSYDAVTGQFDYFTERLSKSLALRMLSLAEIAPTDKIIDIGTGTGVVALQAARIIDSEGMIYGIDLSGEMLAVAEEKAKSLELDQRLKFLQMDAEALRFEDQKFDAAVSLFALLHFPDPLVALKEIYRVIRPNGRLVLAVGSGAPIFSLSGILNILNSFPDIVRKFRGKLLTAPHFLNFLTEQYIPDKEGAEESHLARHTGHNRTQTVVSLIREAGFDVLKTDWLGHQEIIDTPEEFWDIQRTFSSIARKRLNDAAPETVELLQQVFFERCRTVQSKGGELVYPFAAFYVVAQKRETD